MTKYTFHITSKNAGENRTYIIEAKTVKTAWNIAKQRYSGIITRMTYINPFSKKLTDLIVPKN